MCQQIDYFSKKYHYYNSAFIKNDQVVFPSNPAGVTSLTKILDSIKNPSDKNKALLDLIRRTEDKGERNILKAQLPAIMIQSFGNGVRRNKETIDHFTGLTVLDFDDDYAPEEAQEIKKFLFDTYPFIVSSFLSPSGKVKCIMRIEQAETVEEYQGYYRAIASYFSRFKGYDGAYLNAVLIMYYTYDHDILIREDAIKWDLTEAAPETIQAPYVPVAIDPNDYDLNSRRVFGIISYHLNKIVDNGHPQLMHLSKLLGGYVGAGYLIQSDAISWIDSEIEHHPYLRKGIEGYKKTASQFIQYGISEPINLPEE